MAAYQYSAGTDVWTEYFYSLSQWQLTKVGPTQAVWESGDFTLVISGTGLAAGGTPTGTITGMRLFQVDLSSGALVEVEVLRSTSSLSLSFAGLIESFDSSLPGSGPLGYLFKGNDVLTGSSDRDLMAGYAGADTLNGGDGDDQLFGDDTFAQGKGGNDQLNGGAGRDYLDGGAGKDTMTGGTGDDAYRVDHASDVVKEDAGGGRFDRVAVTPSESFTSYTLPGNVENLDLELYSVSYTPGSVVTGKGNGLANKIAVQSVTNDFLPSPSVRLMGMGGNDRLFGGGGDDKLDGGTGSDTLIGAAGDDLFRFSSALSASTNVDTLADFVRADDGIELENSVFTKLVNTGPLPSANFRASTSGNASDGNDHVLYETDTGKLFYDADGNGSGTKVLFAVLTGAPSLASTDFFVT